MFAALGTEPRLRILRLLLAAHPDGLVVGEIQAETDIAGSTLSHHLEKLKNDELVTSSARRPLCATGQHDALQELLGSSTPSAAPGTRQSSRNDRQLCK